MSATAIETWTDAQAWERSWWLGNPGQHAEEIEKGDIVAGLLHVTDAADKSVIDIGCGPFSLLQRYPTRSACALDPIDYDYLEAGYTSRGIRRLKIPGEQLSLEHGQFDEAWLYNVLQHVIDPVQILHNAISVSRRARIFEWTNTPVYQGHPHTLTAELLSAPFAQNGWVPELTLTGSSAFKGMFGTFYVGIWRAP